MAWLIPDSESEVLANKRESHNIEDALASEANEGGSDSVDTKISTNKGVNSDTTNNESVPVYAPLDISKLGLRLSQRNTCPVTRLRFCIILGYVTIALLTAVASATPVMYCSASSLVLNSI